MTINNSILIVAVGYKDKNLANFVKNIKNVTSSSNTVYLIDQHPIDHKKDFSDIAGCEYEHRVWDEIYGPAYHRSVKVFDNCQNFSHVCIVSPDITLTSGWDTNLIDLLNTKDVVFSGAGKASVFQKDLFSLEAAYDDSKTFNTTQIIDRNFIFAKAEAFKKIVMPDFLKYCGENEYLSMAFLSAGYDIMSVPANMYSDSKARSVENTYHTFSLEHNYNVVVDLMYGRKLDRYKLTRSGVKKFLEFHGIPHYKINKLPYATNDVSYNPYDLKMHGVDARRFIAGTKAVY